MITGIPPYSDATPIEYSVRCFCGRRFLVFNPLARGKYGDAESRAKERAEQMGCTFINSQLSPFLVCVCSQPLDFSTALEASAVM